MSKYEKSVNQFIPAAVEYADRETVREYPKRGPRIIGSSRGTGVRLSALKDETRRKYECVTNAWNRYFHEEMNRLTREAGVRRI